MPGFDDLKKLAKEHDAQVDPGLEKAGDAAKSKVGHDQQVDQIVDKGPGRHRLTPTCRQFVLTGTAVSMCWRSARSTTRRTPTAG